VDYLLGFSLDHDCCFSTSSKCDEIELGAAALPISIDIHVKKTILRDGSTIDGVGLLGRPDN
jgi:hypothetical protein